MGRIVAEFQDTEDITFIFRPGCAGIKKTEWAEFQASTATIMDDKLMDQVDTLIALRGCEDIEDPEDLHTCEAEAFQEYGNCKLKLAQVARKTITQIRIDNSTKTEQVPSAIAHRQIC